MNDQTELDRLDAADADADAAWEADALRRDENLRQAIEAWEDASDAYADACDVAARSRRSADISVAESAKIARDDAADALDAARAATGRTL